MPDHQDPFEEDRKKSGVKLARAEGQDVPLLLRLNDVRQTCKNFQEFSSDNPKMIVLHSEADVRDVRQLPIEIDPPDHTDYRALVEPIYRQPNQPEYRAVMQAMIAKLVGDSIGQDEIEVVREFATPLQSRGLAQLLGLPQSEAEIFVSWGVHVFHDSELGSQSSKADQYIAARFEEMDGSDADDFFSVLNRIEFRARQLSQEEKYGFANLAFAGGRDTIINTVTSIVVYLAENPEAIGFLREDKARIVTACEEFVRYVSPLTIISRTCPHATEVMGHQVDAGERIGLCWPSANRDESVFEKADEVVLDRKPNPHVGFGFGPHNCLGQHQARLIIRSLLEEVCEQVGKIVLIDAVPEIEQESSYQRKVGYTSARVKLLPIG